MTRRSFVGAMAAAVAPAGDLKLGIASTCFMTASNPRDTIAFLERGRALGAAGIQMHLTSTEPAYVKRLRNAAERYGMYVETMAELPKGDVAAFERLRQARKAALLFLKKKKQKNFLTLLPGEAGEAHIGCRRFPLAKFS